MRFVYPFKSLIPIDVAKTISLACIEIDVSFFKVLKFLVVRFNFTIWYISDRNEDGTGL